MSIKVYLDGQLMSAPQGGKGAKIRVTLNDTVTPPLLLPAPQAAEPPPAKVMAFWHHDEDAHQIDRPWRYAESPNEQAVREQAERDGAWTG